MIPTLRALSGAPSIDPMGALATRVRELASAQAKPSAEDLVFEATADLAMEVVSLGTAKILGDGTPLLQGWGFDARGWVKREHGVVIGGRK